MDHHVADSNVKQIGQTDEAQVDDVVIADPSLMIQQTHDNVENVDLDLPEMKLGEPAVNISSAEIQIQSSSSRAQCEFPLENVLVPNVNSNNTEDTSKNSCHDGTRDGNKCNDNNIIKEGGNFSKERRIVKGRRLVSIPQSNGKKSGDEYSNMFPVINSKQKQNSSGQNLSRTKRAVRRVQIVSKRAALASKRKIWDSNDASIDAAQSAVDKWEASYQTFRTFLINFSKSAKQVYNTTKSASQKIENGLLVPIRDMVLLPTFNGIEKATDTTIGFIQSDEAKNVAIQSLEIIKTQTPFGLGETVIAPCLVSSFEIMKKTWEIAQYPIPSKSDVRYTVDTIMTGTKWFLLTSSREIYFYAKLVDATVTRTLSHTQWRVLGSGPYSTLNSTHKQEVIDHLCERYFSLKDDRIARYELMTHIKFYNWSLYHDLVITGLLLDRGGEWTSNDSWLDPYPNYRTKMIDEKNDNILLLNQHKKRRQKLDKDDEYCDCEDVKPLWFYQPTQNGKKPKKDTPWVYFNGMEQSKIEDGFIAFLGKTATLVSNTDTTEDDVDFTATASLFDHEEKNETRTQLHCIDEILHQHQSDDYGQSFSSSPSTKSHWYQPDLDKDILIEQKRQAISFLPILQSEVESVVSRSKSSSFGINSKQDLTKLSEGRMFEFADLKFPLQILMRPTLWRFHGLGNEVRRGVWLMDTQRNGLQPYSDESAAILEDAYLFLKCTKSSQETNSISSEDAKGDIESILLTVQVLGPDGDETQLVQFRSLTQITAIQKTIAGGFSLFKRRVYRGVQMISQNKKADQNYEEKSATRSQALLAAPWSLHKTVIPHSPMSNDIAASHLILVVHGIGEMLRSTDVFGMSLPPMTSTIVDCCSSLRKNHSEVLRQTGDQEGKSCFGNIEYLPVEWHEAFALKSRWSPGITNTTAGTRDAVTLKDISLNTIPHMREFANDTMLDILFFMSPMHHEVMINIVCNEMNTVVQKYRDLTGYEGKVSLLAHSLGSVISWDILSQQVPQVIDDHNDIQPVPVNEDQKLYPSLDFQVSNTFMIGSPVAVFLMLRNQHEPINERFHLPGCSRVFNIFHPYDPVAYRIEPLLSRDNAHAEPEIISHWKGGFRVQYQTKILWRKIIDEVRFTQKTVVKAVEAGIEGIGLLDQTGDDLLEDEIEETSLLSEDSCFQVVQVGNVCEGKRLDYMLQEKEIENANEYLSALAAHSSYWGERDLSLFILQQIYESEKGNQCLQIAGIDSSRTHDAKNEDFFGNENIHLRRI